ncbi:MAG: hypothetical protein PHR30_04495 [Gallionellaceae bacterium]|nr:hypothetical protein [Gallionellaceae bacterium]
MTKHSVLLSLLLAALLAPLSGCEPYARHDNDQSRDRRYDRDDSGDRRYDRDDSRDRHYGQVDSRDRNYEVRVVFSDRDSTYIRDYYKPRNQHGNPHGYPPGLAKQGKVPPGQAKKLRRGEPMPQDYRWQPLPRDLDDRLSRLPDGYVRVVVGADIGIMNVRTRVLVDLLEDLAD